MKFWKDLMGLLEKIANGLNALFAEVDTISGLLVEQDMHVRDIANDDPIMTVKHLPVKVLEENYDRKNIIIQNIGFSPCYIKLDSEISYDNFHCVLVGDTSLKFGEGGSLELKDYHGEVYAICKVEEETQLAVTEY